MERHREPSRQPRNPDETIQRIERTLERALPVEAPPELSDRIYRATAESIVTAGVRSGANGHGNGHHTEAAPPADGLAADLDRALNVNPPDDLADRVSRATAERFAVQARSIRGRDVEDKRSRGFGRRVLGRIAPADHLSRAALAAAVLVLVAVGVWRSNHQAEPPRAAVDTGTGVAAEAGAEAEAGGVEADRRASRLVQQIERSLRPPAEPIDTRIMALAAEIDQLALAVEYDPSGDALLEAADRGLDRSYMLEGWMSAF